MKEKIRKHIKTALSLCLGLFIGHSLLLWQDVSANPRPADSAPWYTPMLIEGGILAALMLMGALLWWLLGRKEKK